MKKRVANRIVEVNDYFISNHNRGKLVNITDWEEFEEAKQIYKRALQKFEVIYEDK